MSNDEKSRKNQTNSDWNNKTLYTILQVQTDASVEEIKKSYRVLILKYHPDKAKSNDGGLTTQESTRRFRMVRYAYSILSDPEKRSVYDSLSDKSIRDDIDAWQNNYMYSSGSDYDSWDNSFNSETWEEQDTSEPDPFFPPGFTTREKYERTVFESQSIPIPKATQKKPPRTLNPFTTPLQSRKFNYKKSKL